MLPTESTRTAPFSIRRGANRGAKYLPPDGRCSQNREERASGCAAAEDPPLGRHDAPAHGLVGDEAGARVRPRCGALRATPAPPVDARARWIAADRLRARRPD